MAEQGATAKGGSTQDPNRRASVESKDSESSNMLPTAHAATTGGIGHNAMHPQGQGGRLPPIGTTRSWNCAAAAFRADVPIGAELPRRYGSDRTVSDSRDNTAGYLISAAMGEHATMDHSREAHGVEAPLLAGSSLGGGAVVESQLNG